MRLLAVVLLLVLAGVIRGGSYEDGLNKLYAGKNLIVNCFGENAFDEYFRSYMEAAGKCYQETFDGSNVPGEKIVYIKPYPPPSPSQYHQVVRYHQQPYFPPQYFGYQYGYQPQQGQSYPHSRSKRQNTGPILAPSQPQQSGAGEAEMFYYEKMKMKMQAQVGNATCIAKMMGYLDENDEVAYDQIKTEYNESNVPDVMKQEFIDNVDICRELSECIPERVLEKKPYGSQYGRQLFFFKCEEKRYKEVCLKKAMIDDYYKFKDIINTKVHDVEADFSIF